MSRESSVYQLTTVCIDHPSFLNLFRVHCGGLLYKSIATGKHAIEEQHYMFIWMRMSRFGRAKGFVYISTSDFSASVLVICHRLLLTIGCYRAQSRQVSLFRDFDSCCDPLAALMQKRRDLPGIPGRRDGQTFVV